MAKDFPAAAAPVSVVIPGRNEAETIARVIRRVADLPCVDEVVVVDNGSTDDTAAVARTAGARVVAEPEPGMGHAVRTGFVSARNDWVMKVDADLDRFDVARFGAMCAARSEGIGLVKGNWSDPKDPKPMTRYLVTPAVARLAPGLHGLASVNSGIYLADRRCFAAAELIGSYAVDLDVMFRIYAHGAGIVEVDIGTLEHDLRSAGHYSGMAHELSEFFFDRATQQPLQEWLVLLGEAKVSAGAYGFLQMRARIGGRVTLACDDPTRVGVTDLLSFPSVSLLAADGAGFTATPSTQKLYVAVGPDASAALRARAQALAGAAPVDALAVELLGADEGTSFAIVVEQGHDRASARFRPL